MSDPEEGFRRLAKDNGGDPTDFWLAELAVVVFVVAVVGLILFLI
ncbi:MAG TPA: hypothetical protein VLA89_19335 [Gemmatimonadales bacterium]|nr:hypothetical protein [Gemmatimonadales bacterium]